MSFPQTSLIVEVLIWVFLCINFCGGIFLPLTKINMYNAGVRAVGSTPVIKSGVTANRFLFYINIHRFFSVNITVAQFVMGADHFICEVYVAIQHTPIINVAK